MPNQQLFPQSTYPITGDVQSTPGIPTVTVVGIQGTPVISTVPVDQQSLVFQGTLGEYVPSYTPFNQSIKVDSIPVSDDYDFFVNLYDMSFQVNSSFAPNGNPVLVNGV